MVMENTTTFVYFMETDAYLKVGISKNIKTRVLQVQTGCPIKIHKVSYLKVDSRKEALSIEKAIHNKLSDFNTFGEWFFDQNTKLEKRIISVLKTFNYLKSDIKEFFDSAPEIDISKSLMTSIDNVIMSDEDFTKKLTKLSKYLTRIQANDSYKYIEFTKAEVLNKCKKSINMILNTVKREEKRIKEEIHSQLFIEFEENKLIPDEYVEQYKKANTAHIRENYVHVQHRAKKPSTKGMSKMEKFRKNNPWVYKDETNTCN